MLSIIITMCIYHFVLVPSALDIDPSRRFNIEDIILHYLMPSLVIFDWILFDEKKKFKYYDPVLWMAFPCIYAVFVYIQSFFNLAIKYGVLMDKYIYMFLNYETLGKYAVAKNILTILAVFITIGYFIYGIDQIKIQNDKKILKKI